MGFLSRKRRAAAAKEEKKSVEVDQAETTPILKRCTESLLTKAPIRHGHTESHGTAAEKLEVTARSQPAAARIPVNLVKPRNCRMAERMRALARGSVQKRNAGC
jgi:hypothetical protein